MIEWTIIAILYVCGALLYGVAFFERSRDIKTRNDWIGLVLWPAVPVGALSIVVYKRLTAKEEGQ